ncbi:MAG TPA: hypothetical protein VK623_10775 [Flavobacterium sp.]|nr:hypothetical protein [Flavobacterium sp.]
MASVLVYYFIPKLNISFGVFTQNEWGKIILAGLSAMFILRSSFFSYHDKDSNKAINVGISTILQVFLDSAERSFDREHSTNKLKQVSLVMKDIDFTKAEKNLSVICLNLMLNVSTEEQKKLGESVKNLSQDMDPLAKSIALGIILEQVTGVELLKQAVECLGLSIKITPEKIDVFQQLGQLEKNLK